MVDHNFVKEIGKLYLMLNKPKHYVCANSDSHEKTVFDLVYKYINKHQTNSHKNIYSKLLFTLPEQQIVGRLDKDTTGLVLLTNDGQWNHKITAPNNSCIKCYRVRLASPLNNDIIEQFSKGILLKGESKPCRPAKIDIIDETQARVFLCEGKYHQIKRMFAALGNHVIDLHRHSIGHIELDPDLNEGDIRFLTEEEINIPQTDYSLSDIEK